MPIHSRLLAVVALIWLLGVRPATAITIDPRLWQQFAEEAAFIGIVECAVAGGPVSRYRVVETWKGNPEPGAMVAIRRTSVALLEFIPFTLVGGRYLVTALPDRPLNRTASPALRFGSDPYSWRRISSELRLPLYQGAVQLDSATPDFRRLGSNRDTLEAVRSDIEGFLALAPEERALVVLQVLTAKYLVQRSWIVEPPKCPDLVRRVAEAGSHASAVNTLVGCWDQATEWERKRIQEVVRQSSEPTRRLLTNVLERDAEQSDRIYSVQAGDTLWKIAVRFYGSGHRWREIRDANRDHLRSEYNLAPGMSLRIPERQPLVMAARWGEDWPDWVEPAQPFQVSNDSYTVQPFETLAIIAKRVYGDAGRSKEIVEANRDQLRSASEFSYGMVLRLPHRPPLDEALTEARQRMALSGHVFWELTWVAELLMAHDPEFLVRWVRDWTSEDDLQGLDQGYAIGSWIAVRCVGDRVAHLRSLLSAQEPVVRVAAAVYLAYEDEASGIAALRDFSALPGYPGGWAALALARRGDRSMLDRCIQMLRQDSDSTGRVSTTRRVLQNRVLELLSNTAAANGLSTPVFRVDGNAFAFAHDFLVAHPELAPVDPWFQMLREQKID